MPTVRVIPENIYQEMIEFIVGIGQDAQEALTWNENDEDAQANLEAVTRIMAALNLEVSLNAHEETSEDEK